MLAALVFALLDIADYIKMHNYEGNTKCQIIVDVAWVELDVKLSSGLAS